MTLRSDFFIFVDGFLVNIEELHKYKSSKCTVSISNTLNTTELLVPEFPDLPTTTTVPIVPTSELTTEEDSTNLIIIISVLSVLFVVLLPIVVLLARKVGYCSVIVHIKNVFSGGHNPSGVVAAYNSIDGKYAPVASVPSTSSSSLSGVYTVDVESSSEPYRRQISESNVHQSEVHAVPESCANYGYAGRESPLLSDISSPSDSSKVGELVVNN